MGAWPKGGSGALSWPKSKTRSRKVTESERKAAFAGLNNTLAKAKHFLRSIPNTDHLDDGRGQIFERTRGGRRAGPHHCCAKSPRGTKTPPGSRLVVGRPMSMHKVHYLITDKGRKALGAVHWH
jgi:hypothetical protein